MIAKDVKKIKISLLGFVLITENGVIVIIFLLRSHSNFLFFSILL